MNASPLPKSRRRVAGEPVLAHTSHENFLPYLINRVTSLLNAEFSIELRRSGLTITHWRVLAFLDEGASLGVSALSEKTATDQATLSRALSRLSERGLIEQSGDERDSRMVMSSITPAGRALFQRILPTALSLSSRALRGIDPGAIESMVDTLNILQKNLAFGSPGEIGVPFKKHI